MSRRSLISRPAMRGLILGGAIVSAVVVGNALLKAVSAQGCTFNSDCPPGEICVNGQCKVASGLCTSNQDCPTGQICQNGHCVSSTGCSTDADCPAGFFCDNGTCVSCNQLRPAQIQVPGLINPNMFSSAHVYNPGALVCAAPNVSPTYTFGWDVVGTINQCPATINQGNGSNGIGIEVSAKVIDSAGHPVCNQQVNLTLSGTTFVSFNNGLWVGDINLVVPASQTTDSNGMITFPLTLFLDVNQPATTQNIHNVSCGLLGCNCPHVTNMVIQLNAVLQYSLASIPTVTAETPVSIITNNCLYID